MYHHENKCIDTFDMSTLTYTSCWSSSGDDVISDTALKGCMTIEENGRYFFIISETSEFFFYDSDTDIQISK